MAKTIKFNLICDGKPVRTIEDLQENFSIEDVLKYYENDLLLRWLDVRGYEKEYKKVSEIKVTEAVEIVKELIKIFDVEADEKKVEEGVYMLHFQEERKKLGEAYKQEGFKVKSIIDDYQVGFVQLIDSIIENPNDVARIKANIAELMSEYKWAMDLNYRQLFWKLKEVSPLAIMCFLMNDEARKYYLPISENLENKSKNEENTTRIDNSSVDRNGFMDEIRKACDDLSNKGNIYNIDNLSNVGGILSAYGKSDDRVKEKMLERNINEDTDKQEMYNIICLMIKEKDFISKLGDNLHAFSGVTDGYWKDLETKGKRYMIISMGVGDYVRSAGLQGGDLASTDIENKFVIIDGIDYKSNSSTRQLLYMEV